MTPIVIIPLLFGSSDYIENIEVRAAKDLLNSDNFNHTKAHFVTANKVTSANTTIADWLTSNPSFSLNGQGGLYQSYSVRGLSRWRVSTNVNGIPILTDRRAGNSASFIDPALINNVSVLAGPSSMLYGSGAIAGVISIESETFQSPAVQLSISDSNNNHSLLAASGNDHVSFAFSHRSADEGKAANGETIYSAYEQSSASFSYKHVLDNDFKLQARWLGSLSKDVQKSSAEDFLKKQSIYPEDIHSLFDLSLKSGSWVFNIFDHYQNWDSQVIRIGKRENVTSYQSHTLGSSFYKETNMYDMPIRYGFDWVSRSGVKISDKETDFSSLTAFDKTLIDGNYHNIAAYVQSQISLEDLELNLGSRFDSIRLKNLSNTRTEQYISGNVSAKYTYNETHSSLISIGNAFRFPTLTELFFDGVTPRGNTIGNKDLKTENSVSYEFSHSADFEDLELRGTYFYTVLEDYIERISINENSRSYVNLDKAKINGFELTAAYAFSDHVRHTLSYSSQQGEDQLGNTINDISPKKISLISNIHFNNLDLITDIFYRAQHVNVGSAETALPSLVSANIKATWLFNEEMKISVGITNLFNKLYRTTSDEDAPFANERRIKLNFDWHKF